MSWPSMPSIWHTPTQPGAQAQAPAVNLNMNMNMYQQYALQQQSWEQWQMYQTQLAQWQAQYGEQYQQMQNQNPQAGFVAPPPLPDYQPPPPPPPVQSVQPPETPIQSAMHVQTKNLQQSFVQQTQQQTENLLEMEQPTSTHVGQTQTANSVLLPQEKNSNFNQPYSQYNEGGFRRQNNRTNRWGPATFGNNNTNYNSGTNNSGNNSGNNSRNNRMFGGNTDFTNRNIARDEHAHAMNDHDTIEEKSQEEIAFDIQFQKWEDQLADWKRNNAEHPDKNAYDDFVMKMEECRQKLLQKRETLRQNRLDRIRNEQTKKQGSQNDPPPQTAIENEVSMEGKRQENAYQSSAQLHGNFEPKETDAASLFSSERCDNNAGIPGLDLLSGNDAPPQSAAPPHQSAAPPHQSAAVQPQTAATSQSTAPPQRNTFPKYDATNSDTDSNIVARVTNILGNPEIQSLLSNIQKKQNETATSQSNIARTEFNENDTQHGAQSINKPENIGHFDEPRNTEDSQRNPFRQNICNDFDMNTQNVSQYDEITAKRGRYDSEKTVDDRSKFERSDRFNRDRNNPFTQYATNQDNATRDFRENNKRTLESDNFNQSHNNFNDMHIDFDEFRPIQIIDYQNKKQTPAPFVNPLSFSHHIPPIMRKPEEVFYRKIIEYDHKTKIHPWNWFCPVIQIEYNHTKNGLSLHEHPPPRSIKPEPKPEPQIKPEFVKRDQIPSKYPKWQQHERHEQFPYADKSERYHQSRFEHRQLPNEMPSYSRRNPQERNWSRNYNEWNPQQNYGYERPLETRNVSNVLRADDTNTLPKKSSYSRSHVAKEEQRPKYNLKDLLFYPGRKTRPKKIVILMRGIPGSGKSFVSKMIKEKEQDFGGSARILSIDDYFMVDNDGSSNELSYEFDATLEEKYTQYLLKSFKRTLMDNLYECIIVDCKNTTLKHLDEFYTIARSCLVTPYICELPLDLGKCLENNIHNRSEDDIRKAIKEWVPTPSEYTVLDYSCLFNSADATEEISDIDDEKDEQSESFDAVSDDDNNEAGKHIEDELSDTDGDEKFINEFGIFKSKWDNDTTENKLARLDGINKPIKHTTIEDYLQMDGWQPPPTSTNGKKRVRWADIEQKREQDKQRAIGFIVGQTDWNNLIDEPRDHSNALTAVKYIEKIRKN